MASSSTNIPDQPPTGEQEPLLGRLGAVSQKEDKKFFPNLIIGTAGIAQIGLLLLVASVWSSIFTHDLILFSPHPLLNSIGVCLLFEGALLLQPTHTAAQKKQGAIYHSLINGTAMIALIAGLVIILVNKIKSGNEHFHSVHSILGIVAYVSVSFTSVVGSATFYFPGIFGGADKAKTFYKFHRMAGYFNFLLLLAVVIAATKTTYVEKVLHFRTWQAVSASVLIMAGVFPRIKKQKLGFGNSSPRLT